jgi:methionyl-tRNA formyltransferase
MGTPEIAVASLQAMIKAGYAPVAVVTTPDKPAGRGLKIKTSAVKDFAVAQNLPVLQPEDLADAAFVESLRALEPDMIVVVAFRKLPSVLLSIPRLGAFNLHASLLPQYRGAAPIQWAIINGEPESGVTTFMLDDHIDTGKILYQDKVKITEEMTGGDLHDRLMEIGSSLVIKTISALESGEYVAIDQSTIAESHDIIKKAPKLNKENCQINWHLPVEKINNLVRGLYPYPGAFTVIQSPANQRYYIKVLTTSYEHTSLPPEIGIIETDGISYLRIGASDGYVYFSRVQLEGKRIMNIDELLRGFKMIGAWCVANS